MKKIVSKLVFIFSLLIIFYPSSFIYSRNYAGQRRVQKKFFKKSLWTGRAETYGAPTINLIVDFINDCHYRMRFYYYMGAARPDVIFGLFRKRKNIITLIDEAGNQVTMKKNGWELKGNDNGYRIYLRRVR